MGHHLALNSPESEGDGRVSVEMHAFTSPMNREEKMEKRAVERYPDRRDEPRMQVRDADLRSLVHRHGARPGTDLHRVLRELQRRRDEEGGES